MRMQNKVVVITGGASGIGRATSLLLASQGAKVAVTDIDIHAGQEISAIMLKQGFIAKF